VAAPPDPDVLLAELGRALAERVTAAVPGWVVRCVQARLPDTTADRASVMARAAEAGGRAQADVGEKLGALLAADVDAQRSTPLEVLRAAVRYPTEVLRGAGVPELSRDRFDAERFPDDPYGLSPASLGAVDPGLAEPAVAWGAAKAMAHRRRHRPPPAPTGP
jgi:hypothetical protein